ncbi:sugar 3,4-ketoisomerase [Mucilaginibacter sp. P25]|uniref:WxcM-like domain-containing protein n=2 Tax=Mucilaginibacter TaxID=423349 RepID=A0AAE6JHT3_9SPHI|nr:MULTISPECIES: FdtA/QdtA family cupin domain-containing protein [Mucilaginibacter]QEM05785.1 WxcM-like domain-containing protein [Mucilaginibacter rubeus]QEM18368.1 WxcM-like domain-containing protein [Mucilaginibacter gossypii]QTE45096.1 WxcM-like domain-containing protein [Mucilaginibacter rubeus]QTE51693.1 WxcM-like domain-containing protein [Mucilaginibacter rubeus]QTE56779.1 WxcM-like domain-containing protein [Mucilaginibacter rubeus]
MEGKISTVFDCNIIHLNRIHNRAGNITPVENNIHIPFAVKRVYYLYDIPGGESRAAHGHKQLEQFIVAASGSFDITIDDGINKKTVQLNRPYIGLHIQPGIWRDISNFSSGAICLVLASMLYTEADYLREYKQFKDYKSL